VREGSGPSLGMRIAGGLLVLAMLGAGWYYAATHDLVGGFRRYQSGKAFDTPAQADARRGRSERGRRHSRARRHHNAVPTPGRVAGEAWAAVRTPVELTFAGLALGLLAVGSCRMHARRRRMRETETWQIVLGRDDLAMPYEVEEAIEGVCGALRARWYERILRGQDHLALEIHRNEAGEVAFAAAGPPSALLALKPALANLYPDARLVRVGAGGGMPPWFEHVVRLKKRRSFIFSLQTTRDYQHSFVEALVAVLADAGCGVSVQLVLTPSPLRLQDRARAMLREHEREVMRRGGSDPHDPGAGSVVAAKDAKGAGETQDRALFWFELRVAGTERAIVRRVAGSFDQLRSENELVRRYPRLRAALYRDRMARALPNPVPGFRRNVISSSEFATLWHLPRTRVKHVPIRRAAVRRAPAAPVICRDDRYKLMRDEHGPVGLWPSDRKFGLALIGGQGMGKSSTLARIALADALDADKAIIVIDPKEDLARLLLGLMPEWRTVHYLDLGAPECGLNPLAIPGSPGSIASLFVQALIEANPPGSIQAASDQLLRMAATAVCAAEGRGATVQHVYEMYGQNDAYRKTVIAKLADSPELEWVARWWENEFPVLSGEKSFAANRLDPPKNKLSRLITGIDVALRHPHQLDIDGIIERGEVLIVNGAKGQVGEDNARLMGQLVMQLVHRALQRQQRVPALERRKLSLIVDEAHNFMTDTVKTLLAEGRSAGLEATFAWQYSAQIAEEAVRSGVRSLLHSVSIFRMREMDDARSMAALAMEVYSDRIDTQEESQERLRFSVDDVLRLPQHHAINLWSAGAGPQSSFIGQTLPMDFDDEELGRIQALHLRRQRDAGGGYREFLPDPIAELRSAAAKKAPPRVPNADNLKRR
jgi:hypothetical protein